MRLLFAVPAMMMAAPVAAQTNPAEAEIRTVIASWYEELGKKDKGRTWGLTSPHFIDASPHYRYIDNGSAALGPRVFTSLKARAMEFRYDIDAIRIDSNFARVQVWERGYFYAAAAQKTYESAQATTFLFERGEADGKWRILGHVSSSQGIPPNKITSPMPDLRARYYATIGKDRDPEEDAKKAKEF